MTGGYMFKRKVYNELLEWKEKYADRSACLLEGARRVGKSTIALSGTNMRPVKACSVFTGRMKTEPLQMLCDGLRWGQAASDGCLKQIGRCVWHKGESVWSHWFRV